MQIDLVDSLSAAKSLLGRLLVHDSEEGATSGYIVETEAYAMQEAASHTYKGRTTRNASMFLASGTVYVYFTYGMHFCMNIVTGAIGDGQGVLIRALEPVGGIALMKQRRGRVEKSHLCNGPGKLTQAMGIDMRHNGMSVYAGAIRLEPGFRPARIVQSRRIGISRAAELQWRFYIAGNPNVSRRGGI